MVARLSLLQLFPALAINSILIARVALRFAVIA